MTKAKKADGVAQEVEYVPSKHKTLSSNSSITPQKLKKKQNNDMYV
jgi:hypothetical protein